MDDASDSKGLDERIGRRIRMLRGERGWPLDRLAERSGVSRATLSRLENAEVSATAAVLGSVCAAFGMTLSRLMLSIEDDFQALVGRAAQPLWTDAATGFRRRSVSPPAGALAGEVLECELDAAVHIDYDRPPRPGLEHHLAMIDGALALSANGESWRLKAGDCLRYRLHGPSSFATPAESGAHYFLFMV